MGWIKLTSQLVTTEFLYSQGYRLEKDGKNGDARNLYNYFKLFQKDTKILKTPKKKIIIINNGFDAFLNGVI